MTKILVVNVDDFLVDIKRLKTTESGLNKSSVKTSAS